MKAEKPIKAVKKTGVAAKAPPVAAAAPAAKAKAAPQKAAPKKTALQVPAILLEGDAPATPAVSGPGQRYALGSSVPAEAAAATGAELPEAYGTERLLLTARDPHWLYAHWDLTREQQKKYNTAAADKHLVLRIYKDAVTGQPFSEIHVHPESRNWFVHVGLGGAKFLGELGYYKTAGRWVRVSTSDATLTPPDSLSDDVSVSFETLPVDLQYDELIRIVKAAVSANVPLIEAIQQLRAAGYRGLPDTESLFFERWTPEQERALAEVITMDNVRRVWMGSLEITELIRRHLQEQLSSAALSSWGETGAWSGAASSLSSPFGGAERKKSFWFNVNAELIIYGATEPSAAVTIGGRQIKLRPDGTFSFRFALPDGQYDLPAVATSSDGTDSRSAELKFSRQTQYRGDVGKHPQDPKLKTPLAANVA